MLAIISMLCLWSFARPLDLMSSNPFRMSCPVEIEGYQTFQRHFAIDRAQPKVGVKSELPGAGLTPAISNWDLVVTPIFYRIQENPSPYVLRLRQGLEYVVDRETQKVTFNGRPLLGCSFEKL